MIRLFIMMIGQLLRQVIFAEDRVTRGDLCNGFALRVVIRQSTRILSVQIYNSIDAPCDFFFRDRNRRIYRLL